MLYVIGALMAMAVTAVLVFGPLKRCGFLSSVPIAYLIYCLLCCLFWLIVEIACGTKPIYNDLARY